MCFELEKKKHKPAPDCSAHTITGPIRLESQIRFQNQSQERTGGPMTHRINNAVFAALLFFFWADRREGKNRQVLFFDMHYRSIFFL